LDGTVSVRQEGDTLIVPLVEDVLVLEKRLVLREEVRVTKKRRQVRSPQQVILRREEVIVERHGDQPDEQEG
jgi:stress response protein YsnF